MSTPYDSAGWTQTFSDDFNNLNLWNGQSGTWKTSFYFGDRTLSGNGERQYYMDANYSGDADHPLGVDPFNTTDHPGALEITAEKATSDVSAHIWGYQYTSGLITTEPSFSQQYGYFEMRAQMPAGQGMWPAFWLLPTDKSWPPELDTIEFFGATNNNGEGGPSQYHLGNISSEGGWGQWVDAGADLTQGLHTFGLDWAPDKLTYYVDGRVVAEGPTPADMHKPMYMLANLAVGGNWPGAPDDNAVPGHMLIDYIKAWSHDPNAVPAVADDHHDALASAAAPAAPAADAAIADAPALPPPLPVVDLSHDYALGGYSA